MASMYKNTNKVLCEEWELKVWISFVLQNKFAIDVETTLYPHVYRRITTVYFPTRIPNIVNISCVFDKRFI